MKKEIVILTIYDPNPNMGNRLQNYAVQMIFEKLRYEVKSVLFREPIINERKWKLKYFINKITNYRFANNPQYWKEIYKRYKKFDYFNEKYIKTCYIKSLKEIPMADYYALGSDQLWNPQWWDDKDSTMEKSIYLASFANPEQIVCVSPSFGRDDIPNEWKPWFKEQLSRIPEICVREEAGKKIIKELTGKNASVTIDPTLMLTREEWDAIAEKPDNFDENGNYILTYFLGRTSERVENDLHLYSKKINAHIYRLFDEKCEQLYDANPSNFVYLIKHASLILTDSFHACVFSFIYGRPFLVYDREGTPGMMSRMDTLFEKFDLKRKYINSGLNNDILECDYNNGYKALVNEQKKLLNFINQQINNINNDSDINN